MTTAEVVNEILKGIITAGMLGSVLVAPGLIQVGDMALRYLDKRGRKLKDARVLYYMKRKQLINYRELSDGDYELSITEQGRQRELKARLNSLTIKKPAKWDKKWRLVIFDIPETRRKSRSNLSQKLRQMGFHQLQKSAWIQPYPCRKEIEIIKEAYKIPDANIVLAEIEKIDNQQALRKRFAL